MINLSKCGDYQTYLLVTSVLEIVITAAILALPVRPVLRLSLQMSTRLSILAIFLLGAL